MACTYSCACAYTCAVTCVPLNRVEGKEGGGTEALTCIPVLVRVLILVRSRACLSTGWPRKNLRKKLVSSQKRVDRPTAIGVARGQSKRADGHGGKAPVARRGCRSRRLGTGMSVFEGMPKFMCILNLQHDTANAYTQTFISTLYGCISACKHVFMTTCPCVSAYPDRVRERMDIDRTDTDRWM